MSTDLEYDRIPDPSKVSIGRAMAEATSPVAAELWPGITTAPTTRVSWWVTARAKEREAAAQRAERTAVLHALTREYVEMGAASEAQVLDALRGVREAASNHRVARERRLQIQSTFMP